MWRLLMPLLIVLSSLAPHCALANPPAMAAQHHAGMDHRKPEPGHVHADAACIGCATPARQHAMPPRISIVETRYGGSLPPVLVTRSGSPEPPPPQPFA